MENIQNFILFQKVYDDVCKWQDATQLIPMFTEKLVPLGNRFENIMGVKCSGYGSRSIEDLFGRAIETNERDIPKCAPIAGAVPCDLVDFSGVTTAREFHYKMEKLFHDYLKKHCNNEWSVHFQVILSNLFE